MYNINLHPNFSIEGRNYSLNDLTELSYSFIKEGEEFEIHIGEFILDWIDDSPIITVHSSGSTGTPKAITLKKEQMMNSALATGSYFNISSRDSALLCLPATYIAGKMMLVRAMVLGLDLYIVPPNSTPLNGIDRAFDFGAMVPLQVSNSLPFLHQVKTLIIGGAPISNTLRDELRIIENNSFETYGMTETITHIAVKPLNQILSSIVATDLGFKILPDVEISIDKRDCLVINAPKISDETITTNDVIELVSANEFRWLGRYDNVINSGGIKVHPENIEKILSNFINDPFFIAGIDDEVLGQKVVLVIEGNAKEDFLKIVNTIHELQKYEKPKMVLNSMKFQRTDSGKIQRSKTLEQILKAY